MPLLVPNQGRAGISPRPSEASIVPKRIHGNLFWQEEPRGIAAGLVEIRRGKMARPEGFEPPTPSSGG